MNLTLSNRSLARLRRAGRVWVRMRVTIPNTTPERIAYAITVPR